MYAEIPPAAAGVQWEVLLSAAGLIVTIVLAAWGFWKWLDGKFGAMATSTGLAKLEETNIASMASLRAEFHDYRDNQSKLNARFDKDIAVIGEQLKSVPTQKDIEQVVDRRVTRLESKIDGFTLELVRHGRLPPRPPYHEDNGA